ncbi:HET-domain-containing protein [Decorospora gaudefroyi]|uniref:HET-domain-containing protein n=1 Tax=Decorospora gaudefroyi TaxID=184978 RepID=A0A6A5JZL2_9PLEO|nr:HET-domain-containing protein [Decorospora gaudefroyi]
MAGLPPSDEPSETVHTLCERCSALSFDDSIFSDYVDENSSTLFSQAADDRDGQTIELYELSDRYPQLPNLTASAESGCAFCGLLRDATLRLNYLTEGCHITYHLQYLWRPKWAPELGLYALRANLSVAHVVDMHDDIEISGKSSLAFFVESEGECKNWLQTLQSPHQRALCKENVNWILEHLQNDDQKFGNDLQLDFVPTRLVDVGFAGGSDGIRLVDTTEWAVPSYLQYVALSYCWGGPSEAAQQLRSTSLSVQQHCHRIPPEKLPWAIQDAVKVTRALCIRYLWVDALCIIQGDEKDWARESRNMGLVYSNAYVTICALSSSKCTESFLDRPNRVRVPFGSSIKPELSGMIQFHPYPQHGSSMQYDAFQDLGPEFRWLEESNSTWTNRGWTLQESQMSPRKLLFGYSRIHLSLRKIDVTEMKIGEEPNSDPSVHNVLIDFHAHGDRSPVYEWWTAHGSDFEDRKLSDRRDKFPAMSGLAKVIADTIQDEYVAGLWKGDLIRGLLWETTVKCIPESQTQHLQRCVRPGSSTYISPSWSWMAKDAYLEWPNAHEHSISSECKSIRAWCQPESADLNPYGRITDARVYADAKYVRINADLELIPPTSNSRQWRAVLDDSTVAICSLDWTMPDEVDTLALDNAYMLLLGSHIGSNHIKSLTEYVLRECLPDVEKGLETQCAVASHGGRDAWGLLIHPIGHGQFVRMGSFVIPANVGGLGPFEDGEWNSVELL